MPANCVIIEGLSLDCKGAAGGIDTIYLAEFENVSSVTASSGIVSGITMVSGKKFFEYKVRPENAQFNQDQTFSPENQSYFSAQTLTFDIFKMSAKNRNIIKLLVQNRLMAIVKSTEGTYWLLGQTRGMDVITVAESTGKAMGDKNGSMLTIQCNEPDPANTVNSGIIAALL